MPPEWAELLHGLVPTGDPEALAALEDEIVHAARRAQHSWKAFQLTDAAFVPHLLRKLEEQADHTQAIAELQLEDLYLACACACGVPGALRIFEQRYLPAADVVRLRFGDLVDAAEFRQVLRERLLVARPGQPPRIATYSGRGELKNWVRICAHRILIDQLRTRSVDVESDADVLERVGNATADPELALLETTYRDGFRLAFAEALGQLTARERTLLRYRYVEELEVQQIAVILGRHRVSCSRALSKARERLLAHLRRDVAERMQLGPSDTNSLFRLLGSQFEVSLSRLLKSRG